MQMTVRIFITKSNYIAALHANFINVVGPAQLVPELRYGSAGEISSCLRVRCGQTSTPIPRWAGDYHGDPMSGVTSHRSMPRS